MTGADQSGIRRCRSQPWWRAPPRRGGPRARGRGAPRKPVAARGVEERDACVERAADEPVHLGLAHLRPADAAGAEAHRGYRQAGRARGRRSTSGGIHARHAHVPLALVLLAACATPRPAPAPADRSLQAGRAAPSSTKSSCAASRTPTATAKATSRASSRARLPQGPGHRRALADAVFASPSYHGYDTTTTRPSIPTTEAMPTSRCSSRGRTSAASASSSIWC